MKKTYTIQVTILVAIITLVVSSVMTLLIVRMTTNSETKIDTNTMYPIAAHFDQNSDVEEGLLTSVDNITDERIPFYDINGILVDVSGKTINTGRKLAEFLNSKSVKFLVPSYIDNTLVYVTNNPDHYKRFAYGNSKIGEGGGIFTEK